MTKWEYKTLRLEIGLASKGFLSIRYDQKLEESSKIDIAELGDEGWELVSVMPIDTPGIVAGTRNAVAFFKRPKE